MTIQDDQLLDVKQVAEVLAKAGLVDCAKPKWVNDQISRGHFRSVLVAGKRRVSRDFIKSWIRAKLRDARGDACDSLPSSARVTH